MYIGDTITAIATPPGRGGIGVIRLSGDGSRWLTETVFRPTRAGAWMSHVLRHGWLCDASGRELDESLAVWMKSPHSYTGEDVVELQCHGSPAVLRHVVERLLAAGARLAEPGEFTERAFLNGRLDLAQAEAVADLIDARGAQAVAIAAAQLHGGLSRELQALRDELIDVKALLEVQIDFSEEEVEIDPTELSVMVVKAVAGLDALVASYAQGRRVREGIRVTIVGKPNVGKSSLLNALLGEERAIVTEIAGTTRDVIEEGIEIGGVPVVLSDTAGLRAATADEVERLGMERTGMAMSEAEVLLVVVDGSRALADEDAAVLRASAERCRVLVVNKSDLPRGLAAAALEPFAAGAATVQVSAKRGVGLEALREQIAATFRDDLPEAGPAHAVLTSLRQRDALAKASEALHTALDGLAAGQPPDIVAVAVQDGLDRIGEVTGTVSNEDVLDRVFSRFCLGK